MIPLVFIHIPKTAGTSFRKAAIEYFGEECVCCDYGPYAEETSLPVRRWVIDETDMWQFYSEFSNGGYRLLAGHINAGTYSPLFPANQFITFLRNPVQRLMSNYQAYVRTFKYEKSFEEFFRSEEFINGQSKVLEAVPWQTLGFIGITERYQESLNLLNEAYCLDIPFMEENLNKEKVSEAYDLQEETVAEILHLNAADTALYEQACEQFDWRLNLAKQGLPFSRGSFRLDSKNTIEGWAYTDGQSEATKVLVSVNGEQVDELHARLEVAQLRSVGGGRAGSAGFKLSIGNLQPGDQVECKVSDSGQPLPQQLIAAKE